VPCRVVGDVRRGSGTLFVKSIESNWLVSLHQDLSIPVAEHVESTGCQGWSEKEGELFVQPPVSGLDAVPALRLHLDDCSERNGALRVVPGSHRLGRLTAAEAIQAKDERG
jgi:ectoine hydroxylase-related dioxygenase (phytanoyl-CoA dioxygenase family)